MGEFCRLRVKLNVQRPLRRGYGLHDCTEITPAEKNRIREDLPFSLALKAELNLEAYLYSEKSSGMMRGVQDDDGLTTTEADLEIQKEERINEGKIENNNANILNSDDYGVRKTQEETLKRARHGGLVLTNEAETNLLMEYSNQNGSAAANRQADRT
ncbi:hypothetical protein Goshw_027319 [Gossypium schwendimanii]|uniref:Uncharacterized protein n=1 Tax=Gossypium schwendimanii TaxID=34291 RepID=A0A7J9MLD5_GOSSC|nr:hypothetical protein [Gossypium schwendimanii]